MARTRGFERTTVLGLALAALAAGVISGLSVEQQTYTVREVKAHTSTPYDLLVLPKGAGAVIAGLADPNAIDEGAGGITLAQWKAIEALPGVAVAAPLAPLGATEIGFSSVAPWLAAGARNLFPLGNFTLLNLDPALGGWGLNSNTRPFPLGSSNGSCSRTSEHLTRKNSWRASPPRISNSQSARPLLMNS